MVSRCCEVSESFVSPREEPAGFMRSLVGANRSPLSLPVLFAISSIRAGLEGILAVRMGEWVDDMDDVERVLPQIPDIK